MGMAVGGSQNPAAAHSTMFVLQLQVLLYYYGILVIMMAKLS